MECLVGAPAPFACDKHPGIPPTTITWSCLTTDLCLAASQRMAFLCGHIILVYCKLRSIAASLKPPHVMLATDPVRLDQADIPRLRVLVAKRQGLPECGGAARVGWGAA